ncbi:MAG: hypothetical protein KDI32_00775 [Pseudomonadales bacterium]|jgi:hypothetical protein|nr:hypothetical protein [Pseudomonadales bacterium]
MEINGPDPQIALEVIALLAEQCDPASGMALPHDSIVYQPNVSAALLAARRSLEAEVDRQARRAQRPCNVGAPWTTAEERLMMAAFDAGHTPADIAATLQRSIAGVESRLERLGRLAPQVRTTRDRYRSRPHTE